MRMATILAVAGGLAFLAASGRAAPLRNVAIVVTQPDGTDLDLFASGDEFYNWVHDERGFTMVRDPTTGWVVYADRVHGALVPTALVVGASDPARAGLEPGLLPVPEVMQARRSAIRASMAADEPPVLAPRNGIINNLVVFIRFSDETEFGTAVSVYDGYLNSNTSNMQGYFLEASYGALTVSSTFYPQPSGGMVVSYRDVNPRAYYQPYNASTNPTGYVGETDRRDREHALLKRASEHVSPMVPPGLNLDGDGNGFVDNVCFIVRGSPGGWAELLWPHRWSLYSQTAYIQGKRVYDYNFQLQSSVDVGVLAHEMFHSIGAPDLYHYNHDWSDPVGYWDLMEWDADPPQHMSAYMKFRYGNWISSIPTITFPGTYTLSPLTSPTNNCYRINTPNSPTQYFVIEYRRDTGTYESSIPGSGLIVYRINSALDGQGNSNGPPDEVYAFRPGGTPTANGTVNSANFSSNVGRTVFNASTNPYPFLADGTAGSIAISSIGSAGTTITFYVDPGRLACGGTCFVPVCTAGEPSF